MRVNLQNDGLVVLAYSSLSATWRRLPIQPVSVTMAVVMFLCHSLLM